jgi:hypothetical protein
LGLKATLKSLLQSSSLLLLINMNNGRKSFLRTYIADINNIHSTADYDKVITCTTNVQHNCCTVISTKILRHNVERAKYSIYYLREENPAPTLSIFALFLFSLTLHLIQQLRYQDYVPKIAKMRKKQFSRSLQQ